MMASRSTTLLRWLIAAAFIGRGDAAAATRGDASMEAWMGGQSFSALPESHPRGAGALVAAPSLAEVRHVGDWRVDPVRRSILDRTPRDEIR
jgi:hypothetical protein